MKPGDKVIVIATDEQLEGMGMDNPIINNNLRKYESTISEELVNAKCKDEKGNKHSVFVLDSTFTMPGMYLKNLSQLSNDEEKVEVLTKSTTKDEEDKVDESPEVTGEEPSADSEEV